MEATLVLEILEELAAPRTIIASRKSQRLSRVFVV